MKVAMMAIKSTKMPAATPAQSLSAVTVWCIVGRRSVMTATKSTGTVAPQNAAPSAVVTGESMRAKGATMATPRWAMAATPSAAVRSAGTVEWTPVRLVMMATMTRQMPAPIAAR